jgi:protein-export chaperone SecB
MSESEIFIYAIVAAFFAYRLWSVLGKTNGDEKARASEHLAFAEKIKTEQANKNQPMKNPPKMGVSIDVAIKKLKDTSYEVTLRVGTKAAEDGKTIFLVEVLHGGIFTLNPAIPEENHTKILFVECAAVIFPYTRRIISDLTSEGGFPPVQLEPMNFEGIYQQKLAQS